MLASPTIAANLLVPMSLEALLSQSASRLDLNARLQRLHAAALLECAITGYADLKIADIAERAKVSTASIYKTYKDRDALLVAAIETLFSILAGDIIELPVYEDPVKQVEHLLIAHGEVYAQPLSTWLFRLYASLAWSGQTQLRETGLRVFKGIDSFWCGFLSQLMEQGHLVVFEPSDIVPHLLGPIERCTIMWQLGCGDEAAHPQTLTAAASHGAKTLFRLWGRGANDAAGEAAMPVASDPPRQPSATITSAFENASAQGLANATVRLSEKLANIKRLGTTIETQDRLLLAATAVCQERGYQKASMQEVAARAKVSTATLYKLYQDKADLFGRALEQEFKLRISFDDAQIAQEAPQDQIASTLCNIAARANDPEWVWMLNVIMASEISGTPAMIALGQQYHAATEAFLAPMLNALVPTHVSDADRSGEPLSMNINFLLGAVERHSVLSLILFGQQAVDTGQLERLASASAAHYLRLTAMSV